MSAPVLTVRYNEPGSPRTFAPGSDVVVGRDLRADIRIPHPLVSRAHVLLRFDRGRWIAVDNGSLNGMYVHGRRVPEVDIADGTAINLGNPDGPPLQFEVGRHQGSAGRPPQTSTVMIPPPTRPSAQPVPPPRRRTGPPAQPTRPAADPTPAARADAAADRAADASPVGCRADSDGSVRGAPGVELQSGDLDAEDPAAGITGAAAAGRDDDRPGERERHRHPRRAGLAASRHADPHPGRGWRSSTTAASTAPSSTARGWTPHCCATATWSPSATSTWSCGTESWCGAPRPPPPPGPVGSTCAR